MRPPVRRKTSGLGAQEMSGHPSFLRKGSEPTRPNKQNYHRGCRPTRNVTNMYIVYSNEMQNGRIKKKQCAEDTFNVRLKNDKGQKRLRFNKIMPKGLKNY